MALETSPEKPAPVRLWDIDNDREAFKIQEQVKDAWSVACSSDGNYMLTGHGLFVHATIPRTNSDGVVRVWEFDVNKNPKLVKTLKRANPSEQNK